MLQPCCLKDLIVTFDVTVVLLLKKSQYLLTGNATIREYEDTVVPKMDVLSFVYK